MRLLLPKASVLYKISSTVHCAEYIEIVLLEALFELLFHKVAQGGHCKEIEYMYLVLVVLFHSYDIIRRYDDDYSSNTTPSFIKHNLDVLLALMCAGVARI